MNPHVSPPITLIDILYSFVIGGIALIGTQYGFNGLLISLIGGYVSLCALLPMANAVFGKPGVVLRSFFPASDINCLLVYIRYYFHAQPIIAYWNVMTNADDTSRWVAIGMSALSSVTCLAGLVFLWRYLVAVLTSSDTVARHSTTRERVMCYVLLLVGLFWVALTAYWPLWMAIALKGGWEGQKVSGTVMAL